MDNDEVLVVLREVRDLLARIDTRTAVAESAVRRSAPAVVSFLANMLKDKRFRKYTGET